MWRSGRKQTSPALRKHKLIDKCTAGVQYAAGANFRVSGSPLPALTWWSGTYDDNQ